jgi:hypothetical protein
MFSAAAGIPFCRMAYQERIPNSAQNIQQIIAVDLNAGWYGLWQTF